MFCGSVDSVYILVSCAGLTNPGGSNIINDQRRRVLALHSAITELQLTRSSIPSDPESDPEDTNSQSQDRTTDDPEHRGARDPRDRDPRDAAASVLRNRLFGQHREGLLGHRGEESTDHVLSHHRMLQDEIAEEMVGMARGLRDRSVAFGEALREDSKVYPACAHTPSHTLLHSHTVSLVTVSVFVCLFVCFSHPLPASLSSCPCCLYPTHRQFIQTASEQLSKNKDKMTRTGNTLQVYTGTSRGMMWFILGAVGAVLLAWLVMYFVIRVTSFVGV